MLFIPAIPAKASRGLDYGGAGALEGVLERHLSLASRIDVFANVGLCQGQIYRL